MEMYAIVNTMSNEVFLGKDGKVLDTKFKYLRALDSKDLKLLSINEGRAKAKLAQLKRSCRELLNFSLPEHSKQKVKSLSYTLDLLEVKKIEIELKIVE